MIKKEKEKDIPEVDVVNRVFDKIVSPSGITRNQREYIKSIKQHDVVFCQGPPGSGKTYLAVGMAMHMYKTGLVDRIIVARPAIEAGEELGFLPGDIDEKMNPFLRPIFDSCIDFASTREIKQMRYHKILEIIPIAYMRGITTKNSFVIIDESQNIKKDQMKMILTRFGMGSKMVLTGDIDQSDLKHYERGAFKFAFDLYSNEEDIGNITLEKSDIQRHPLVSKMLNIWEKEDERLDKIKNPPTMKGVDYKPLDPNDVF